MATSGVNPDGSERKREDMLARAVYAWPTPDVPNGGRSTTGDPQNPSKKQIKLHHAVTHGPPAQENPSTRGSRQESWATATVSCGADKQKDGSMTPKLDQQVKQWATPEGMDGGKTSRGGARKNELLLTGQVKAWATPRAEDSESAGMRHGRGTADTLTAQTRAWPTPTARDNKSGRGNSEREYSEREYSELTPMIERNNTGKLNPRWVETLMGIPIGWTMPSCSNPVTIEQTSCACLETESARQRQQKPSSLYYKNSPHTHNHHGITQEI
jgi:hypothetical protein